MGTQQVIPLLSAVWALVLPTALTNGLMTGGDGPFPPASVVEIRIVPAGDDTEIMVRTEGAVTYSEFALSNPNRLVLNIEGARHALSRWSYEEIARGGVIRLRSSQFRDDVVRLVFDLTIVDGYEVVEQDYGVSVRFPNPGTPFDVWSTELDGASQAMAMNATGPEHTGVTVSAEPSLLGLGAQESEQPHISVAYDSASMLDVLAGFSEFSGLSIVSSSAVAELYVRGIEIRDQPWDLALDAILSSQGVGWRRRPSGIIEVDVLEGLRARDTLQTETRVFRINYASADSVAATLAQLATPDRGQVVAYQGTNSVIITDVPTVVERMDNLVRELDRRTPQVSIEAKIIFVNRTDVNELGIIYDLKDRPGAIFEGEQQGNALNQIIPIPDPTQPPQLVDLNGDGILDPSTEAFFKNTSETVVDLSGSSVASLANANDRVVGPALSILTSISIGDYQLFAFLEALESHSLSDVQAAPAIQVVDNHQARIHVGEKTPVRTLEAGAQTRAAEVTVNYEDTGIILDVTPHITNNGQILLDLHAERSALRVDVSDVGFVFEKQVGQTRLLLDNGQTAVIGGLTLSEVSRSVSGIPGLMNIPVLGWLFRTTKDNERKIDLIILVTPHIVETQAFTTLGTN